jgi:lipopolysaccharide/colanic/teichoic acid biosynthesis glycosyltransferase
MSPGNRKTIKNKQWLWLLLTFVVFILATWLHFFNKAPGFLLRSNTLKLLAEILTFGLFSFLVIRLLNISFTEKISHYRIGFLSTIGTALIFLLISSHDQFGFSAIGYLLLVAISGFTGGFIASSLSKGLLENYPPSPRIEREVLDIHQAYMGSLLKTPNEKRFLDITFSIISLIISMPIWLIVIFLIWYEDPGPVIYVKNAIGRGGINFKQLKFRSMVLKAEKENISYYGDDNDNRELIIGHLLRKTALDELPQLINILIGQMSYVGPRPHRTMLVHDFLQRYPDFAARHQVRPGLAGLAQVSDHYNIPPEEKLAWDLEYINRATLWFDIKIVLSAFLLVFVLRWRSKGHPELIVRKLLKIEKPDIPISTP